jgi:dTDP-4-amino-4,6-dideoxygalactose transaminase
MTMSIPIFRLNYDDSFIDSFISGATDILESGFIGEGKYVKLFEKSFSNLVKSKYCTAVTNGTNALEIALKAIGVSGKKVILPSNTFFATAVAVKNAGAEILLVDIEEDNFSICPNDLSKKIINHNVGAVILVHIGGIISKHYKEIQKICKNMNIALIEDAAHAHTSNMDGIFAGSIGDIGCFSFFPTKVMTTGEGGMITTNSKQYYDKIKSIKNFGRDINDEGICVNPEGQNSKVNEFTGLMGHLESQRVQERVSLRNKYVNLYERLLSDTNYEIVKQERGLCSYYKCILKIDPIQYNNIKEYCDIKNIRLTGEVYRIPIHKQPLFKNTMNSINLPITDKVCSSHICPPLYPELTEDEIYYICDTLKEIERISK